MIEEFKDILDYPGYRVSNYGYVVSVKYSKPRKLKMFKDRDGYLKVSLSRNGKQRGFMIHRLVAIAFIPNDKNLDTVDHINGDKMNNRSDNLQWLSRTDNVLKYCKEQGKNITGIKAHDRYGGRMRGELRRIPIAQYDRNNNLIKTYVSYMDAERQTGIRSGGISACINGYKPSAGGYIWRKM